MPQLLPSVLLIMPHFYSSLAPSCPVTLPCPNGSLFAPLLPFACPCPCPSKTNSYPVIIVSVHVFDPNIDSTLSYNSGEIHAPTFFLLGSPIRFLPSTMKQKCKKEYVTFSNCNLLKPVKV